VVLYGEEVRQMAWNNWRNNHEGPEGVGRRMAAVILTGVILGFLFSYLYVFFLAPVR
jgi:hypothetical protein